MEQIAATEHERAASYKALAECYHPPDERLAATLGDLARRSEAVAGRLLRSGMEPAGLDDLKIDHARLFVGPYKLLAPPYASLYLGSGRLMDESTAAVQKLYDQQGLQVRLKEAPDHICVELEFVCFLVLKAIEAARRGDLEEVRSGRRRQAHFLATCLVPWLPDFAQRVEANAETEFYRTLARLTASFVPEDLKQLRNGGLARTS